MGAQVEAYIYGSSAVGYSNSGVTLTIGGIDYASKIDAIQSLPSRMHSKTHPCQKLQK